MAATGFPRLVRADGGEPLGDLVTVTATGEETGGRLTAVEFLDPPGFAPPVHRHAREEEMFLVLDGHAAFTCGERTVDAGPGDFVLLAAGVPHTFVVSADGPLRTLQITVLPPAAATIV